MTESKPPPPTTEEGPLPIELAGEKVDARKLPLSAEDMAKVALAIAEEKSLKTAADAEFQAVAKHRRWAGYVLGLGSMAAIVYLAVRSFAALDQLLKPAPVTPEQWRTANILIVAHAVVTVALIFFAYQVLRAAERLALPWWWAERHAETAKIMLGIKDPVSTAAKVLDTAVETLSKLKPDK